MNIKNNMDFVFNKFITNDPLRIYNLSLHYIMSYQKKKVFIGKCLERLIDIFNHQITGIVNICIYNIDNLNFKQQYLYYRDIYLKFISMLLYICKFKEDDTPLIKSNKHIHNSIIQKFYSHHLDLIKKYNDCILFVDKVLNIFNTLPKTNYIVKGILIHPHFIIYSNVCEVVDVDDVKQEEDEVEVNQAGSDSTVSDSTVLDITVLDEDDISRLPPKKRYRK